MTIASGSFLEAEINLHDKAYDFFYLNQTSLTFQVMATSTQFVPGVVGGLLLALTACQPRLFLPVYESADSSKLPPLRLYQGFKPIDFCQLPAFARQLVYVRGRYTSDNRESSDFEPLQARSSTEPQCLGAVELTLPSYDQLPPAMRAKLIAIHQDDNHRIQYLVVDAIGQYDQDKPGGYGHMGYEKVTESCLLIKQTYLSCELFHL
jgi:hypothetical protein